MRARVVWLRAVHNAVYALLLGSCSGNASPPPCFEVHGDPTAAAVGAKAETFPSCSRQTYQIGPDQIGGAGWHTGVFGEDDQQDVLKQHRATLVLDYTTADVVPVSVTESTPPGTSGVRALVEYGRYPDEITKTVWLWRCGNSSADTLDYGTFEVSVTSVSGQTSGFPLPHGTVHAVCPPFSYPTFTLQSAGFVTIDGTF